jgi:hypothetical protein
MSCVAGKETAIGGTGLEGLLVSFVALVVVGDPNAPDVGDGLVAGDEQPARSAPQSRMPAMAMAEEIEGRVIGLSN